jgi:pilus assembly protein Flp/PilA
MIARMLSSTLGQARNLLRDEQGATAIEYTLIAGFIGLVIVVALTSVGTKLVPYFETIVAAL